MKARFERTLDMLDVFNRIIKELIYGIEQCATNDGASAHICGCVHSVSSVFTG